MLLTAFFWCINNITKKSHHVICFQHQSLLENLWGGFCCIFISFCCHLLKFLILLPYVNILHSNLLLDFTLHTLPWTIARFLNPFYTFTIQAIAEWHAMFSFNLERYGVQWALFTHRRLTSRSLSLIYLIKAILSFLEICSNHNYLARTFVERFIFIIYHILALITCGKKFSL